MLQWEQLDQSQRLGIKLASENSFAFFIRVFFQFDMGQKFLWNWHHAIFCWVCEQIYEGKIRRVIVNTPPGSTKTEVFSIFFVAWGMLKCSIANLPSRWLPVSYSSDLVDENGGRVQDLVLSEAYRSLWPMELHTKHRARSNWLFTDRRGNKHRLYGASLGGQITGRRAGFMREGFTGALINDDPQPPKDEARPLVIHKSNVALTRVTRSRLAHDDVPIAVIQQRVAQRDATNFLMEGGSPDTWERIKIPALVDGEYLNSLAPKWRKKARKDTGFQASRVSYWEDKEPLKVLELLETTDNFLLSSQYQQEPDEALIQGQVFSEQIKQLIEDGRLCRIPVERMLPCHTLWDLGGEGDHSDPMAIWVFQVFRFEFRLIGAYSNQGKVFEHYIQWMDGFKEKHGIRWGIHHGPHDLAVKQMFGRGRTRLELAKEAGIEFKLIPRVQNKGESISALREIFHRFYIDPDKCSEGLPEGKGGWDAIKRYRFEYDPVNEVFTRVPVHDWASNFADALQQLGLGWQARRPSKPRGARSSGSWMG